MKCRAWDFYAVGDRIGRFRGEGGIPEDPRVSIVALFLIAFFGARDGNESSQNLLWT